MSACDAFKQKMLILDYTKLKISLVFLQIFDDHYHFEHKTLVKRSISPSHHHQRRLSDDDRVLWSKQQRAKSRQKRDFTRLKPLKSFTSLLNDPKWPSMWYLVSPNNSISTRNTANRMHCSCVLSLIFNCKPNANLLVQT